MLGFGVFGDLGFVDVDICCDIYGFGCFRLGVIGLVLGGSWDLVWWFLLGFVDLVV